LLACRGDSRALGPHAVGWCRRTQALRRLFPKVARAIAPFRTQPDQWGMVDLEIGDVVHVVSADLMGGTMWRGVVAGRAVGNFPASHVKLLDASEVRVGRQRDLWFLG